MNEVLFVLMANSIAQQFAITRKRKGVPIHKHWEADFARMQILAHERSLQLVVFFKDFDHGACMNFALKGTDVFERSDKGHEHSVRIVDAKFALPSGPEDAHRDFVSLDLPAYPAEHDDIVITFADESGQWNLHPSPVSSRQAHTPAECNKFVGQLPATVGKASRLASLKR